MSVGSASIDGTQPTTARSGTPAGETYAAVHLDAARGLAALAVVAYHVRYNFFLAYDEMAAPTWLAQVFYTATSFGHDAVMVFFVLSGYLISGSILRDLRSKSVQRDLHGRSVSKDVRDNRWSWTRYLTNRLTRLYVVLLPGLLLTVFWDQLGMHLFASHPAYTGAPQTWSHDFFPVAERSSVGLFFANLAFLQSTSGIPAYGSAGPLWSLTWEFAYYLIFPVLLLLIWPTTRWPMRVVYGLAAVLLFEHFGRSILLRFPIWLFGFGVQLLPVIPRLQRADPRLRNLLIGMAIVTGIALTHVGAVEHLLGSALAVDTFNGAIFAIGLYVLLHDRRQAPATAYVRLARAGAGLSYSLYVVHMSLLLFLRAWIIEGRPWTIDPITALAALGVCAILVAYGTLVWYLAESRTGRVRELVTEWVKRVRGIGGREAVERAHA